VLPACPDLRETGLIHGYGSHTYSWINADGQIFWVKYHFISDQGIQSLTQAEADRLVSVDGDDDWGQAGTLVRDVMDDAERGRVVSNVAGHLRDGVTEEVLQHTFEYWKNIDKKPATRSKPRYVTDRPSGPARPPV
jgi:catalase